MKGAKQANITEIFSLTQSNQLINKIQQDLKFLKWPQIKYGNRKQCYYFVSEQSLRFILQKLKNEYRRQSATLQPSHICNSLVQVQQSQCYTYLDAKIKVQASFDNKEPNLNIKILSQKVYQEMIKVLGLNGIGLERRHFKKRSNSDIQINPFQLEIRLIKSSSLAQSAATIFNLQKLRVNFYQSENVMDLKNRLRNIFQNQSMLMKVYQLNNQIFQSIPFQQLVCYHNHQQYYKCAANISQQYFYQLHRTKEYSYRLQFCPGKQLKVQTSKYMKQNNMRQIMVEVYDGQWVFPEQPQYSRVDNCAYCMMYLLLYIKYQCSRCDKLNFFCTQVCHYQYLKQHSCIQQAQQQIISCYGQQYLRLSDAISAKVSESNTSTDISFYFSSQKPQKQLHKAKSTNLTIKPPSPKNGPANDITPPNGGTLMAINFPTNSIKTVRTVSAASEPPSGSNNLNQSNGAMIGQGVIDSFSINDIGAAKIDFSKYGAGFSNIKNTCYLNSSIQNLIRTQLTEIICELDRKNRIDKKSKLVRAYLALIKSMQNTSVDDNISQQKMKRFKQGIDDKTDFFRGNQQHDAHQFIMSFFSQISQQMNVNKNKKPIKLFNPKEDDTDEVYGKNQWLQHISTSNCPISHLFYGQTKTQTQCNHCKMKDRKFQVFSMLSISIPEGGLKVQTYFEYYGFSQKTKSIEIDYGGQKIKDLLKNVSQIINFTSYKLRFLRVFIVSFRQHFQPIDTQESVSNIASKLSKGGEQQRQLFIFETRGELNYLCFKFLVNNKPFTYKKPLFFNQSLNRFKNEMIYNLVIQYFFNLIGNYTSMDKPKSSQLKNNVCKNYTKYIKLKTIMLEDNKIIKSDYFQPDDKIQFNTNNSQCQIEVHLQNFTQYSPEDAQIYQIITKSINKCTYKNADLIKTSSPIQTIENCLKQQYNKRELLANGNQWFCPTCNQKRRVYQSLNLYKTNKYLLIHLKRFKQIGPANYNKNQNKISVKLQLNLQGIVKSAYPLQTYYSTLSQDELNQLNIKGSNRKLDERCRYKLIGMVLHQGRMGSGHYTAVLCNSQKWWEYNDDLVTKMNINDILNDPKYMERVYILFYVRIQ